MFPLIKDHIYAVDIEVKPLPEFEPESFRKKKGKLNPNFYPWQSQIYGMAVCWGENSEQDTVYFSGMEQIRAATEFMSRNKLHLCAHNVFYDWMNLYWHFELPLAFRTDSGVVSQCVDNSDYVDSFGLKQTTKRLYGVETQDTEIKQYLVDKYRIAASEYGAYIHLCPQAMVEKYCRLDAYWCWRIVNDGPRWIKSDISPYMMLYMNETEMTIRQFIEGITVDREGFEKEVKKISGEIKSVETEFISHPDLALHIEKIQQMKFDRDQAKLRKKILDYGEWSQNPKNKFNIGSNSQLKELFRSQKLHWDEKKQRFVYPHTNFFSGSWVKNPESPKLGRKFLFLYGEGGRILGDRSEKVTLRSHIKNVLNESSFSGRLHPHINLLGTHSGRISASGVNIIAAPLADERYGTSLVAENGWSIASFDIKALEPTILANLSEDPLLKYVTFEGEGKEPFVSDGILWIDDIYIMGAYSAPFMKNRIEGLLDLTNWVKDPDGEKSRVKELRSISKTIILSTNYGAGAARVQERLIEDLKIHIPLRDIRSFQDNYWASIPYAYNYRIKIEETARTEGLLVNIGGFPLVFSSFEYSNTTGEHKALNRIIQSSAAVVMKLWLYYLWKKIRNSDRVVLQIIDVHDAGFFKIRDDFIEWFRQTGFDALQCVNETLKLPLKFRMEFKCGKTFHGAK